MNSRVVPILCALVAAACGIDDEDPSFAPPPLPPAVDAPSAPVEPKAPIAPAPATMEQPPNDVVTTPPPEAWLTPVTGRISSRFGDERDGAPHDALDIAAPMGTEVIAPVDLRIVLNAYKTRAGRYLVADTLGDDDEPRYRILFAHLSHTEVYEGQRVGKGELLGLIGLSGSATGPHLHLRVERVVDAPEGAARETIDPLTILREADVTGAARDGAR